MASRPRLKPYFRPLRRGPDSVQLGVSAEAGGVILSGITAGEVALLERLDGTCTEHQLKHTIAGHCGVDPARVEELLAVLRSHRLLATDVLDRADLGRIGTTMRDGLSHDADVLALVQHRPHDAVARVADRRRRRVVVSGSGRLPWSIGSLLRSSGVGQVHLGRWAVEAADQEMRDRVTLAPPDLVVLVAEGAVDPRQGEPWRRRSVPQLPVVSDGGRIVVGPLVGHAPELPCLRCLEMTRADRDAAWPAVMAQLTTGARDVEIPSESTIVAVAAGVVAMMTHAFFGESRVPAGVSVEVALPWPRLDQRRWQRHPGCPMHALTPAAVSPTDAPTRRRVTMTG